MMKQQIWIPGPLPDLNQVIGDLKDNRRVWRRYRSLKKIYSEHVYWIAYDAKLKPMKSVFTVFTWHMQNQKIDPDNIAFAKKYIFDGLKTNKIVLANDGWKQIGAGWRDKFVINRNRQPGILVKLFEVRKSGK